MFAPDKSNPAYSASMEVLALLPKRPCTAELSVLVADLGLSSFSELRPMFAELDRRGVSVLLWREGDKRLAAIHSGDWQTAQHIGEQYVDAMERYDLGAFQ